MSILRKVFIVPNVDHIKQRVNAVIWLLTIREAKTKNPDLVLLGRGIYLRVCFTDYSAGTILTKERIFGPFFWKSTTPSAFAKSVSSLPIPTFLPG